MQEEYHLDVLHIACETQATPHNLPKHHVHDTSQTTNRYHTASTTRFGQLMSYCGMIGAKYNTTAYEGGQIKHSMYDISPGHPLSTVASTGTTLVFWDNASDSEEMATALWCGGVDRAAS